MRTTKKCAGCGQTKNVDAFYRSKTHGRPSARCKPCTIALESKRRAETAAKATEDKLSLPPPQVFVFWLEDGYGYAFKDERAYVAYMNRALHASLPHMRPTEIEAMIQVSGADLIRYFRSRAN